MKVAVIGANGKVATQFIKHAAKEHAVTAFIRNKHQRAKFQEMGVQTSLAIDLTNTSVESIITELSGFDAVVFGAGAGGKGLDLTLSVDLDGAVKCAEAVKHNGTARFILVSALYAQERAEWWDTALRSYYIAKKYADQVIMGMDIPYTILQPGLLLDEPASESVMDPSTVNDCARGLMKNNPTKTGISREDVALAIMACLQLPNTLRKSIPLVHGTIPIHEALEEL